MAGTLHLIPVALGATAAPGILPPDTLEAARGLRRFIVENAKSARAELKRMAHPVPMRELHMDPLPESPTADGLRALLAPLVRGESAGLMSEAGCPAIADPGALLVREAHRLGIQVRPHVGPSSLILALMASGLEGQRFAFHGYLPVKEPDRTRRIRELENASAQRSETQIFIETPYRNAAMWAALVAACRKDTLIALASDLTLPSESVHTLAAGDWRRSPAPPITGRPTVFLLLAAASR